MKRYVIAYMAGGQMVEERFLSKAEAFRWFNAHCPAEEAELFDEDESGVRGPAKRLRRRTTGRPTCGPAR
ncbi:MAG: hypothetical protein FWJ73_04560 [Limnochordales bacterium]|jgi:hypothetical protein|nr:hypothetical protein [Bacillota bacterium]